MYYYHDHIDVLANQGRLGLVNLYTDDVNKDIVNVAKFASTHLVVAKIGTCAAAVLTSVCAIEQQDRTPSGVKRPEWRARFRLLSVKSIFLIEKKKKIFFQANSDWCFNSYIFIYITVLNKLQLIAISFVW